MDILDVIIKNINDKTAQLKDTVCSERLTSFDDYKRLCGEIHGLEIAKGYILDAKDRLED